MSQNQPLNNTNQPSILHLMRPVGLTLLATLVGMSAYELVKPILWPGLTLWQSPLATIIFSSILAAVIAGVVWRKVVRRQAVASSSDIALENVRLYQSLRESEEKYRTLVEASPDAIITCDLAGRITYASQRALEMYGSEDLLKKGALEQIAPEEHEKAVANFQKTLSEGWVRNVEYTLQRHDGSRYIGELDVALIKNEQGQPQGFMAIARDITTRKQAQCELERRITELSALNTMATIVSQSLDGAEILNRAIDEALQSVGVKAAVVYLPNKDTHELVMAAHRGIIADLSRIVSQVKPEITTSWLSAQGGAAKVIQIPAKYAAALKLFEKEHGTSLVQVPLIGVAGVIGVMYLRTSRPEYFDAPGLKLLTSLGQQIAIGLEKARLYSETRAWAAELEQRVKERMADLAASEIRYRTLFNSALDALFVMNLQGDYLDANPAACQLLGYSREELLTLNFFQVVQVSPAEEERIKKGIPVSWRRGRVGDILRLTNKSGQVVVVEASLTPLTHDGQEVALSVARDITQRAKAEQALRESETRYRIVSELTADYVFILKVETDGQVVMDMITDNFFAITGRTMAEIKSPDLWAKIFPTPEDYALVMKSLHTVMVSGQPIEIECRTALKNNELRWTHIFARPQWDEAQQRVVAIIGAVKDITARKEAEEALKQYSERLEERVEERTQELRAAQEQLLRREKLALLGQLAGSVAHELRNPLGAVKNVVYFLKGVLANPTLEVAQSLEILNKEVDRSDRIISSLLDFARSKQPSYQQVNLNKVIEQALAQVTTPETIEVIPQLADTLPFFQADPEQLAQVFNNLLLNAIQSMSPPLGKGGQLVVKTTLERPVSPDKISPIWAVVAISDTGVGMSPENQAKLFEPLFTTKAKGIGLGLPLVKAFVEGHGGIIEAKSQEGVGSTFTVKLPVIN